MKRIFFAFLTLFLAISSYSFGQNFVSWRIQDRYFSFSLGTGASTYFGELNYSPSINFQPSVANLGLEARLLSKISARFSGNFYQISGDDSNAPDSSFQKQRNLSFQSKNFQFGLDFIYYFKKYRGNFNQRWTFNPYIFIGFGLTSFNPATTFTNKTILLRDLETEGVKYGKIAGAFPLGVGGKFKVNEFLNINLEITYFYTTSDYLDDVSKTYSEKTQSILSEALSDRKDEVGVINKKFYDEIKPGAKRGNPTFNDSFLTFLIKLEVYLPNFFAKQ